MKIVTDCAADMPAKERDELGVVEAPLFIQFPEGEVNSADITPDEFYNRLEAMRPEIPTTALPSSGVFTKLYPNMANPLNSEGFISWLEFRQPVKLVTRAKASIFSLEALPYGDAFPPPKLQRIEPIPNLTINPKESN